MADWLVLNIPNKWILSATDKASLINIPNTEFRFWWSNKIFKANNNGKRLLYTKCSQFHIFKSKNVNNNWVQYDEQTIGIEDFLKLWNNRDFYTIYLESKYVNSVYSGKSNTLLSLMDENFDFVSFWIDKKYYNNTDTDIVITMPHYMNYEVTLKTNEENEEIKKSFASKDFYDYLRKASDNLRYNKFKKPDKLIIENEVTINSSLVDTGGYSETGMLRTTTQLFEYQQKAVAKLLPSRTNGLFMDMGVGKTRTALELIKIRQNKYRKLIWFTPVSLKYNIFLEFMKHTNLSKDDIFFFNEQTNDQTIIEQKFIIVGIESVASSDRIHLALKKIITADDFIVVDESTFIKGNSSRTQRLIKLTKENKYKMILTGTPISQGIVDLYTQFYFLSPKILGYKNFYHFVKYHLQYSVKHPGMIISEHNQEAILVKINPYVYQIKKEECLNLPPKQYIPKYFQMSSAQREEYENAKKIFLEEFENYEEHSIFILFNELQQIASGFRYHKNNATVDIDNTRLELLKQIVEEIEIDENVIIWTKYTHNIKQIENEIKKSYGENSCVIFDGSLNEAAKKNALEQFSNNSSVRFFISTMSSGGFGLNLTKASYTIFYNNGFKYLERIQAEDRNHRIGQVKSVTYIDILCDNSIDIKIDNSLSCKANVVSSFKNELDSIKDKKLKKAILNAIIDGDLKEAEKIKKQSKKSNVASRMEKHRRKKGIISRSEYLEKNSISRLKPWEQEGVSRATWYRNK